MVTETTLRESAKYLKLEDWQADLLDEVLELVEKKAHQQGREAGAKQEREKLIKHFKSRVKSALEFGDRRGRKLYEGIIASLKLKSGSSLADARDTLKSVKEGEKKNEN